MKKALIHGKRICEVLDKDFPAAPPLHWVDVPDDTTTLDKWVAGEVIKHNPALEQPIDQSDLDQLQKQMKAVLLCVAQVGGLTVPQIKAMFKNTMDALP